MASLHHLQEQDKIPKYPSSWYGWHNLQCSAPPPTILWRTRRTNQYGGDGTALPITLMIGRFYTVNRMPYGIPRLIKIYYASDQLKSQLIDPIHPRHAQIRISHPPISPASISQYYRRLFTRMRGRSGMRYIPISLSIIRSRWSSILFLTALQDRAPYYSARATRKIKEIIPLPPGVGAPYNSRGTVICKAVQNTPNKFSYLTADALLSIRQSKRRELYMVAVPSLSNQPVVLPPKKMKGVSTQLPPNTLFSGLVLISPFLNSPPISIVGCGDARPEQNNRALNKLISQIETAYTSANYRKKGPFCFWFYMMGFSGHPRRQLLREKGPYRRS